MLKILISLFLLIALGCSSNNNNPKVMLSDTVSQATYPIKPLHILTDEEEGGGADIRLFITQIIQFDTITFYKAISSYKGYNVGIEIDLPNKKADVNQLTIKSCGQTSNNLLTTLAELYGFKKDTTQKFINTVKVSFIDLDEFAKKKFGKYSVNDGDTTELKLFFEPSNQDDYAELFLNINDRQHYIEIAEKDQGYRKQVIQFLTQK